MTPSGSQRALGARSSRAAAQPYVARRPARWTTSRSRIAWKRGQAGATISSQARWSASANSVTTSGENRTRTTSSGGRAMPSRLRAISSCAWATGVARTTASSSSIGVFTPTGGGAGKSAL